MSRPVTEFMNGGVVTSRAPSLLKPGELQRGDDCIYRDKDPAIWRAPGRIALNSTALHSSTSAVKGLKYLSFDKSRDSQLLAYGGDKLWRAPLTTSTLVANGLTFQEISGAGRVEGAITSTTTFTATSGYPFTADAVGAVPVFIAAASTPNDVAPMVTAVSGPDPGDATHFNILTLSNSPTNQASCTLAFDRGVVQSLANVSGGDPNTEMVGGAFYGSSYFVWLGNGSTYRLEWKSLSVQNGAGAGTESIVMRATGLDAVIERFTLALLSGTDAGGDAYAWPTSLGIGVYWFLLTEIYGYTNEKGVDVDVAECSYLAQTSGNDTATAGEPIAISVPALTNGVRLTTPVGGAINNGSRGGRLATHWGVYMSIVPTTDTSKKPDISLFRRVRREKIKSTTSGYGVSQVIDIADVNNNQGWVYPTIAVGGTTDGKDPFLFESLMTGRPDTGRVARAKSGSPVSSTDPATANAASTLNTFVREDTGAALTLTAPWANRPVIGITLRIRGYAEDGYGNTKNAGYEMYLVSDTGAKRSNLLLASGSFGTRTQTNYHGGPGNTLGVGWVTSDFGSSMKLIVRKSGTGAKQSLAVDSVGLYIHWSSGTINTNGPPYRIVTFRDQIGTVASDPANFPNPLCNTGDFFQGALVTNDMTDETIIRWSLPDNPESVPRPYQIAFNTAKKDKVTFIRSLGPLLLVGLEESVKRVNYLPTENDTDLQTGLAQEDVATDHGIAGPQSAVRFDMPGVGTLVLYASSIGMMLTNGITSWPVSDDIDWPALVKLAALTWSQMRIYAKEKLIAFYYCPAGATHNLNTRVMYFSYQVDKIKRGALGPQMPMIGPSVVSGRSGCDAFVGGATYLLTGSENNGKVYMEDSGTTIPSGYRVRLNNDSANGDGKSTEQDVQIIPLIRTRKMFASTLDMDTYTEKIYLHFYPYGSALSVSCTTTISSTAVTSSTAFGSVLPGYRFLGTGVDPETIVLSKSDSSNLVTSRASNASGAATRTFDSGTVAVSVRGSNLGEAVKGLRHHYVSTLVGDLVSVISSNIRRGFELQIEKVPLTFDANGDTATWADLGTNMRLHHFTLMLSDSGLPDTNRNAS